MIFSINLFAYRIYTINFSNSSSLIFRIIFVVPPRPGEFSRPATAVGRGLPGCGKAELMLFLRRSKILRYSDTMTSLYSFCLEGKYAPFTELSEASVYFIHASCGCGALSERSELCGAIANKRMYEIRKRSVFSKRSVYLLQAITFKSFFSLFSFPNLPHQFRQLAIFPGYIAVVLCLMWQLAVRAVFDSLICHSEIPAAFIPQRIQWTIAEQTVKILGICSRMTRKIFTFFVTEKCIMFSFPIWFLHLFLPPLLTSSISL